MRSHPAVIAAAAAAAILPTAVVAQDVVVMRRAFTAPRAKAAAPAPAAEAVTCPTTPTSRHGLQNSASGWTKTSYNGVVADGLAQIKAMDGKRKYYLLLKYSSGGSTTNVIYATDEAPIWLTGTPFAQVAGDGYYVCTGNR